MLTICYFKSKKICHFKKARCFRKYDALIMKCILCKNIFICILKKSTSNGRDIFSQSDSRVIFRKALFGKEQCLVNVLFLLENF